MLGTELGRIPCRFYTAWLFAAMATSMLLALVGGRSRKRVAASFGASLPSTVLCATTVFLFLTCFFKAPDYTTNPLPTFTFVCLIHQFWGTKLSRFGVIYATG